MTDLGPKANDRSGYRVEMNFPILVFFPPRRQPWNQKPFDPFDSFVLPAFCSTNLLHLLLITNDLEGKRERKKEKYTFLIRQQELNVVIISRDEIP